MSIREDEKKIILPRRDTVGIPLASVEKYETAEQRQVDGVVGTSGSNAVSPAKKDSDNSQKFTYDNFEYVTYKPSDTVTEAEAELNKQLSQKPGEYTSSWQAQLDDTINKILNREKFSYDFNSDALYQQYKDKYIQQGKMAMADTVGQASAMTGGYGNSYAVTAGSQAYQASLENLNDIIPELYQIAYDRYNQERQDLYNEYSMFRDRESTDYDRHRDTVSDWQTERDYLAGRFDSERDYDYGKYSTDRDFAYGEYSDDMSYAYQAERDKSQSSSGGSGGNTDDEDFQQAVYSRTDDYGNSVFYRDGKEQTFAKGVNPYTGTTNPDTKNGTFSNGYQPNNIKGQKLSKSGITDVVNGVIQNVWKTPDGKLWIWDGTKNSYLEYRE